MSADPSHTLGRTGRDVLVVEDELRVRNMLGQALQSMSYTPAFAASAELAAKALAGRTFDIMILDLNLPGVGGIEFLEHIRRDHGDMQVIILTGFGDLDAARKAIHLDVVDFLTKPCTLANLETALDRASKRRRGQLIDQAAASVPADVVDPPKPTFIPEAPPAAEKESMEQIEQRSILSALKRHNGNRTAAAAELGISVRKLYYRLGEYQLKGLI